MSPLAKELERHLIKQENNLFKELDQAIDEMEEGQTISLNKSITQIKEKEESHEG